MTLFIPPTSYTKKKLAYRMVGWLFFFNLLFPLVSVQATSPSDPVVIDDVLRESDSEGITSTSQRGLLQRLVALVKQLMQTVLRLQTTVDRVASQQEDRVSVKISTHAEAVQPSREKTDLAGTYRCWSYNVSGGSGNCRIAPPLIVHKNGRYQMSSERGTYTVVGDTMTLSESKIRGPGTIVDGNKIRFEYTYNGWQHTVTYLKSGSEKDEKKEEEGVKKVSVDITVLFPESENYTDSVNVIAVYDGDSWVAESLAYPVGKISVRAHFSRDRNKGLENGKIYDVRVSNGFSTWSVGSLDLRGVTKDIARDIRVVPSKPLLKADPVPQRVQPSTIESAPAPTATRDPEPQPVFSESQPTSDLNAPLCDPNIPKYSQPGCRES